MEIKVNIPKNDYVQPTEVREKIVQDICTHIVHWMIEGVREKGFYSLIITDYFDASASLYLVYKDKSHTETSGFGTSKSERYSLDKSVKVRTCEMKAAFEAIQEAGYNIFPSYCTTDKTTTYVFTTKPVLDGRTAKKVEFDLFID